MTYYSHQDFLQFQMTNHLKQHSTTHMNIQIYTDKTNKVKRLIHWMQLWNQKKENYDRNNMPKSDENHNGVQEFNSML